MEQIKKLPKVGFIEAVKRIFTRALKLNTRSRRSEFWWGRCFSSLSAIYAILSQS